MSTPAKSTAKTTKVATTAAERRAISKQKMNKFEQILSASGQEVLDNRSKLIAKGTSAALADKIRELEFQKDTLELEVCNLTDVSVKNKDSLNPAGGNFSSKAWIAKLAELKLAIKDIDEELEVYYEIEEEYFTVAAEETEE